MLPTAVQRLEIADSQACLEAILDKPVTSFAYPNGVVTETARAILPELGFDCACASANGVAWSGSDRYRLPRFWVPDLGGAAFGRWLNRWITG
jgi:peptidoglycan/xylan/chitin deacetylase (PgdA/CDA1 family)